MVPVYTALQRAVMLAISAIIFVNGSGPWRAGSLHQLLNSCSRGMRIGYFGTVLRDASSATRAGHAGVGDQFEFGERRDKVELHELTGAGGRSARSMR